MSALPYLDRSHGFGPLEQFGTVGGLIEDIRYVRIGHARRFGPPVASGLGLVLAYRRSDIEEWLDRLGDV